MRKFFIKLICFSASVFASIVCLVWLIVFVIPPQFEDLPFSVIIRKYDRLMQVDSPRIILVGGSSGAFGIDQLIGYYWKRRRACRCAIWPLPLV